MEKVERRRKIKFDFFAKNINEARKNVSVMTFVAVIAILTFLYFFVSQSIALVQVNYEMTVKEEKIRELQNENKILEEQNEKITTDQYIEENAREKLGMVKTGELPIKIIEKEETKVEETKATLQPNEKVGIYMKDWFLKMKELINFSKRKK